MAEGTRRRILVLGRSGQVGRALQALSWPDGWQVTAWSRSDLDLADTAVVAERLRRENHDLLINAAAYTAVDRAEEEPALARAVNSDAVRAMGEAAAAAGRPVIHLSTDYVFDGRAGRPYRDTDPVSPINVYGASKAAGEAALLATGAAAWILRTAWVTAPRGENFLRSLLAASLARDSLHVVADQIGNPSPAGLIATGLRTLGHAILDGAPPPSGTYHLAGDPPVSRYALAREAFAVLTARRPDWPCPRLTPISTAEWPTAAPRPADTRLETSAMLGTIGLTALDWRRTLPDEVLAIADDLRAPPEAAATKPAGRAAAR